MRSLRRGSSGRSRAASEDEEEEEDEESEEEGQAASAKGKEDEESEDAEEAAKDAKAAAPVGDIATRVRTGKLYFLFLLKDGLPHADVWAEFFKGSSSANLGLYAHCQNSQACQQSGDFGSLGITLVPTVPSKWCVDLVTPTWQLLRKALQADAGAAQVPRKYVFVSDTSLPLRPLSSMRQVLFKSDNSDICMSPENEWASVDIFGVTYKIVKSHQWAVLNQMDAEAFVRGWEQVNSYSSFVTKEKLTIGPSDYKWVVPRMGSNGRANFSATIHRSLIPAPGRCPDEEVLTTLIFGLHEPRQARRWKKIAESSHCRTYVNWGCPNPPEVFTRVTDKLLQLSKDPADSAYLFARKFNAKAKLEDLKALLKGQRF